MIQNINYVLVLKNKYTNKLTPVDGEIVEHRDGTYTVKIKNLFRQGIE